jgi:hypothetical protein
VQVLPYPYSPVLELMLDGGRVTSTVFSILVIWRRLNSESACTRHLAGPFGSFHCGEKSEHILTKSLKMSPCFSCSCMRPVKGGTTIVVRDAGSLVRSAKMKAVQLLRYDGAAVLARRIFAHSEMP